MFTYRIPQELAPRIRRGVFVMVPFRRKRIWGICMTQPSHAQELPRGIRDVIGIRDHVVLTPDELRAIEDLARLHGIAQATAAYLALPAPPLTGQRDSHASYKSVHARGTPPWIHDALRGPGDTIAIYHTQDQRLAAIQASVAQVCANGKTALVITPHRAWLRAIAQRCATLPVIVYDPARQGKREQWAAYEAARHAPVCLLTTRAGAFVAPPLLGAIIIDLAHEDDHQQWDAHPKYDTRIVTKTTAVQHAIPRLLLTSAPTAVDWTHAVRRIDLGAPPLNAQMVHLDQFWKSGGTGFLTHELRDAITAALERRGAVLVLHNRRGRMGRITCRDCNAMLACTTCGGALADFTTEYRCRTCETAVPISLQCGKCKSPQFLFHGIGTQGVADMLHRAFPDTRIARVDREAPEVPAADAQMIVASERFLTSIAPTFHRPIALVVVLHAERFVRGDDWRGTEQLLHALRGVAVWSRTWEAPLLVQTAMPHHPALKALEGPLTDFYRTELAERAALHYPPDTRLLRLDATDAPDAESLMHLLTARHHGTVLAIDGPYAYGMVRRHRITSMLVRMPGDVTDDAITALVADIPQGWTSALDPIQLHT
ncbi:MAG: hypothetical protein Q7T01_04530 [bacterium]|nr:hypothetical protein [bacterium]